MSSLIMLPTNHLHSNFGILEPENWTWEHHAYQGIWVGNEFLVLLSFSSVLTFCFSSLFQQLRQRYYVRNFTNEMRASLIQRVFMYNACSYFLFISGDLDPSLNRKIMKKWKKPSTLEHK